ncbi:acetolactate synthase catalytic subunit [Brevibacterium album]|uniref:acetolactate synthase catalytic subunit n=1 Tax=Brevibacterium album TaxID=417948 RepID=UPI00041F308A|nr:acetolactate synthase catalytic subunit [Brevibacterium album]
MSTVAEHLAERLRQRGLRHFFGQSLPSALVLALEAGGVEQIAYRTENAGGAMADGFSRVGSEIGVVTAQNGPAAALLVAPLLEAKLVRSPVLAIVQEVPSRLRGKNAFQEIDHFELFRSCTKAVLRIDDADRAVEMLDRAVDLAGGGVPGPVVLLAPADILIEEAVQSAPAPPADLRFPADRSVPAPDRIREAVEALAGASRPLVVAGGGVRRSDASAALRSFAERRRIPVATTNMGKGTFDEAHELSVGVVGNVMAPRSTTHGMDEVVRAADVILVLGARMNENGTDSWKLFPRDAVYIQVDLDADELGRNYPAIRLRGDVRVTLEALDAACEELSHYDAEPVIARIAEIRKAARERLDALVDMGQTPVRPERVVRELAAAVPEDAILVADASYSTIWLSNCFPAAGGRREFVEPRGMAGLGWGLPMAIGAKVAHPSREVVCLTGDGGFGHVWQELETLTRMRRKVIIVLLDNGILGFQKHAEIAKYSGTTTATEFHPVDHAAVARAAGVEAVEVEDPGALAAVFAAALAGESSVLISVRTDPRAYPPITAFGDLSEAV